MENQLANIRVKQIMSKDVVAVSPHDSLHEALELIVENRISALPVTNSKGQCIGLLSTSDLIDLTHELEDELQNLGRASVGKRQWLIEQLVGALGSERVAEQMTEDVATVTPEATLPEAAAIMLRNRVHRLPVTDAEGRLLGIVSTIDIMGVVADSAPAPTKA